MSWFVVGSLNGGVAARDGVYAPEGLGMNSKVRETKTE